MSLNLQLATLLEHEFGEHLAGPIKRRQDAVVATLVCGVELTVRYAAADAYSLRWRRGEVEAGIDTAPFHRDLATFPNHFHDVAGGVHADPLTDPEATPEDNLRDLVRALLADPALGSGA